MEFREATIDDAEALAALRRQQLADEGEALPVGDAPVRDYFRSAIADGTFVGRLALEGGVIVATGGLCLYRLPPSGSNPSGNVAYVTNMFTLPAYRRRGIATALLERILGEARGRGCAVARLHASADGEGLYRKFGFTPSEGYMALRL